MTADTDPLSGVTAGPYTDPLGPDMTTATWHFFAAHPKTGGCAR